MKKSFPRSTTGGQGEDRPWRKAEQHQQRNGDKIKTLIKSLQPTGSLGRVGIVIPLLQVRRQKRSIKVIQLCGRRRGWDVQREQHWNRFLENWETKQILHLGISVLGAGKLGLQLEKFYNQFQPTRWSRYQYKLVCACSSIQRIDTERNIDVCIHTFTSKLYPLRGSRNNDIHLPLRSWFLNTILQKRNQSSLENGLILRLKQEKWKMNLKYFVVSGSKKCLKRKGMRVY